MLLFITGISLFISIVTSLIKREVLSKIIIILLFLDILIYFFQPRFINPQFSNCVGIISKTPYSYYDGDYYRYYYEHTTCYGIILQK